MASTSSLSFTETGEAVVQYTGTGSRRHLLFIEIIPYAEVLICCFQFKKQKYYTGSEMRQCRVKAVVSSHPAVGL